MFEFVWGALLIAFRCVNALFGLLINLAGNEFSERGNLGDTIGHLIGLKIL